MCVIDQAINMIVGSHALPRQQLLSLFMTGLISAAAHAVIRENAPAAMIQPVLSSQLRRVRRENSFFDGISAI